MSNRFDSYLKGAKLARMHAQEARISAQKGDDKRALRQLMDAFGALLTATNNFAHLQFHPRKKSPLGRKKAKVAAVPATIQNELAGLDAMHAAAKANGLL